MNSRYCVIEPEFETLQKWLNHRQFWGYGGGLSIDEYCSSLRLFQHWKNDGRLLSYIAPTLAGDALIWWSGAINTVTSFEEFEEALHRRFSESRYTRYL